MNPRYPIYVISKGRADKCLTARELKIMNVPFTLVVEKHEFDAYRAVHDSILLLPFSNLGEGSTPARNFVWNHSVKCGHLKHWILDDNIEGFHRMNRNEKPKVTSGTIFKIAEDFTDRYENVAISGFNYYFLCKSTDSAPPYQLNTRIYSCMLIRNDIQYRWRGRFNEDTDLSLRVLKDGWCTILFNAFLAGKVTTMRMSGGNTDSVYKDTDNRREFAESLRNQHPDVVDVVWKFNRWHHKVNYKPFKVNKLIRKQGLVIEDRVNEYGMYLGT